MLIRAVSYPNHWLGSWARKKVTVIILLL